MTIIQQRSEKTGHPVAVVVEESECYCERDFTLEEFKNIIALLRQLDGIYDDKLWEERMKGGLSPEEKSYEKTIQELNRVMDKYDINTCLRKIHFIAQVFHETDRFYSSQEYDNFRTSGYDPYRGRGVIHLTGKDRYEDFCLEMGDENILQTPDIVATNLKYVFESGAWFWKKGKQVNKNIQEWRPSAFSNELIISEKASTPTFKVKYGKNRTRTAIDLNLLADNDWIYTINYLVNGGTIGFYERVKYRDNLKKVMNYESCKNNPNNQKSEEK